VTNIERLLDKAASDVKASLRHQGSSGPVRMPHRLVSIGVSIGVVGVGLLVAAAAAIGIASQFGDRGGAPFGARSATELMILADGVVTEQEYRDAVKAVAVCGENLGLEVLVDFNDPKGYASFSSSESVADSTEPFGRCIAENLPSNVVLGWAVTLGDADLGETRADAIARLACVEERTGKNFGSLVYDEFGYPTPASIATMDAALKYEDHGPWGACSRELFPDRWSGSEEPATPSDVRWDIMTRDDLVLSIGVRSKGGCVAITGRARAVGVCGADTSIPLNFSAGALYERGFVAGWVPRETTRLVLTLGDGSLVETTDLATTEEYQARFFLEAVPINDRYQPDLPIAAVAYNDANVEIARFVLSDPGVP